MSDEGERVRAVVLSRAWRVGEGVVLFGVLPVVLWRRPLPPVFLLLGALAYVLAIFRLDPGLRAEGGGRFRLADFGAVAGRWALLMAAAAAAFAWAEPEAFLRLPRERPGLMLAIALAYPVFSALPQTLFFRPFFFHRYGAFFPSGGWLIAVNGLAFGWAHLLMNNAVAVALAAPAGALFAWTYLRARSVWLSWLEHALYGLGVFAIGLGRYFYGGTFN